MDWDVTTVGRHRVIIVPSQKGIDVRINQRGVFVELKMGTRDPLMAAVYDDRIVDTVEMSDSQKDEAKAALQLIKKEAAMAKMLNIKNMQFQMSQIDAQMQQGAQQVQQQAEGALPAPPGASTPNQPSIQAGAKGTPLEQAKPLTKIEEKVAKRPQA
jgi:hypothetical protein